jgi:chromosome segregation ATPase
MEALMLASFDSAREQLCKLKGEVERPTPATATEYDLGYWRQQSTDILSTIYEGVPNTRDYVLGHLKEADQAMLLRILENASRFEPSLRISPSSEEGDAAYFATLVNRTIARSWFFRIATSLVVTMISVTAALLGFQIYNMNELSKNVAQDIEQAKGELMASQRDMAAQVDEARNIRERMVQDTAGMRANLIDLENDTAAFIARFEAAKRTFAVQQQELNEVRARWTVERAAWDDEIPALKSYFATQKARFEESAVTVLASLEPLLEQGRTDAERVQALRQDAEAIGVRLNTQLTQVQEGVSLAARAAEAAESSRIRIDDMKAGVEAKVAAATSAAESASASAAGLLGRLDESRGRVEVALADSDQKGVRLSNEIARWDTSLEEWLGKLVAGEQAVAAASAAAIDQIALLSKDPEATLDRRRAFADSVVADIERRDRAAADLLQGMNIRDDALRSRESETRATLDEMNETLSRLRRQLNIVAALTETIDGHRSEAEAELDALLAERPPLTIATLWQMARSSLAVTATLIVSTVAVLMALVALVLSWRQHKYVSRVSNTGHP